MNKLLQAIISIFKKSYDSLPEQASPQTTAVKPAVKPNTVSEPQVKEVIEEPTVKESTETHAKAEHAIEAAIKTPTVLVSKITTDNLPQDSIQRRHVLSKLQNIIETLKGPRPSDSIQSRHYEALVNSLISQALTDKVTLDNLYKSYKSLPKTVAQEVAKFNTNIPETVVQAEESPAEQEVTAQTELFEPVIPAPPTDSILCRHYDTLINNELNRLLEEE
jgi:hypothetical protein